MTVGLGSAAGLAMPAHAVADRSTAGGGIYQPRRLLACATRGLGCPSAPDRGNSEIAKSSVHAWRASAGVNLPPRAGRGGQHGLGPVPKIDTTDLAVPSSCHEVRPRSQAVQRACEHVVFASPAR